MIFNSKPRITQYFAENPDFYAQWYLNGHEGLDMVPTGDDWGISAWFTGVVASRYTSNVYGETLIVYEPKHGLSWRLAHMTRIFVNEGSLVDLGQQLGVMGNTPSGRAGIGGKPMPAHLHINCIPMKKWGTKDFLDNGFKGRVDPLGVLRDRGEL